MPRGIVAGAIPGFAFETARARLAPGGAVVLFSDGVTEAVSPSGELFGHDRLRTTLESTGQIPALDRVAAIRGAVQDFTEAPARRMTSRAWSSHGQWRIRSRPPEIGR